MAKRSKGRFNEPGSPDMGASGSSMSMEMVFNDDVGRKLANRYQITRVIGEGGMGVVYEAYDSQVDRDVAIKVVRSECLSDTKFLTRFRREMEVTTRLRHPSTIRVFERRSTPRARPTDGRAWRTCAPRGRAGSRSSSRSRRARCAR
jgi:hypothetical protein